MKIDNSFFESNRIGPASALIQTPETGKENTNAGFAGGFENIFNELWEASSDLSAASRAERAKLLTGTQDNMPGMMIASEKSSIMFELNLNVRNKVIDAYQEVMRTQI